MDFSEQLDLVYKNLTKFSCSQRSNLGLHCDNYLFDNEFRREFATLSQHNLCHIYKISAELLKNKNGKCETGVDPESLVPSATVLKIQTFSGVGKFLKRTKREGQDGTGGRVRGENAVLHQK